MSSIVPITIRPHLVPFFFKESEGEEFNYNGKRGKSVFNINGTATIGGAFIADNSTKSGTSGTLLGAGEFASARSVISGDTLNVTVTCSITSA